MTAVLQKLPILILSPHSRCNCRCVMCDIWKDPSSREISADELARHLEDIRALGVEWVIFSGGEPLMHSDLFRLCAMLRSLGIRLTLLSTGLLLRRHARSVVESIDEVIVSLDGPRQVHDRIRGVHGAFDLLRDGVAALQSLRSDVPVHGRCTVQKRNHTDLVATVDAAHAAGLLSISFLAADLLSDAFNRPGGWTASRQDEIALDAGETIALEAEVERLIADRRAELESGFIRENPDKLRRIVTHFRSHLGLALPAAPRCNAPWISAVVESDGTVRPCFFHAPIGSLRDGTLAQIVNGPAGIQFRQELRVAENSTCQRCVCSLYRPSAQPATEVAVEEGG